MIKIRASSVGKIMTNPQSKKETYSKTMIGELQKIWIEQKYGRSKEIQTLQMEKGITQEEDAITLLSKVDKSFYVKNEENLTNDYLTGTPDIITNEVIDIKSSWDIFSFFKSQLEDINKDYYYQLQSYMDLTGLDKARLVYCLVSTPESLISREKDKLTWNGFLDDPVLYKKAEYEIDRLSRYEDIPAVERVYQITINRNDEDIQAIHERVKLCREYWNQNFKL